MGLFLIVLTLLFSLAPSTAFFTSSPLIFFFTLLTIQNFQFCLYLLHVIFGPSTFSVHTISKPRIQFAKLTISYPNWIYIYTFIINDREFWLRLSCQGTLSNFLLGYDTAMFTRHTWTDPFPVALNYKHIFTYIYIPRVYISHCMRPWICPVIIPTRDISHFPFGSRIYLLAAGFSSTNFASTCVLHAIPGTANILYIHTYFFTLHAPMNLPVIIPTRDNSYFPFGPRIYFLAAGLSSTNFISACVLHTTPGTTNLLYIYI